jgi:non-specific serine/threonine protein kinase
MDPERYRRVEEVFGLAIEHGRDDRALLLDSMCAGDAELRREVDALLAEHDRLGSFLAEPPRAMTVLAAREELALAEPRPALEPGDMVDGKYRVEAILGRGGMGEVYRATQLSLDRPVALKVIRNDLVADAEMLARFQREAHAIARLRHPNIVTVHDYGVHHAVGAFIVMEYLDGRSLRQELKDRKRFPADEAAALIGDVCAAVAAAHAAGVVHRDLKPDNVVLEAGAIARAKVLDFGIAKLARGAPRGRMDLTAGGMLGTPAYMAPEQVAGDEVDGRADIYSIGCMLYELVTGRPPFTADSRSRMLHAQLVEVPRPPGELAPGLPTELETAILRAIEKDRENRFQTVEELHAALGTGPVRIASAAKPDTDDAPFAPTVLSHATTSPATDNNLPRYVASFIGRDREVERVSELLAGERLVTLVGPGGIGKTRLAVGSADAARNRFAGGAWLVDLAALSDPRLVAESVAATLGVSAEAGEPLETSLVRALRDREILLVLDNCEHVVDACAQLTADLLHGCINLRVLATSREALGTEGETRYEVTPLGLPDAADDPSAEELATCDAVRLFVDRARSVKPGFALTERDAPAVAGICRELDGIPLAIELAAARVRSLSTAQILERLRDRFRLLAGVDRTALPRHQTLRAAVDWSYELLTDAERVLFARTAVFAGGWDLEAAEAVCARGALATEETVDLLARLVDKSLVAAREDRDGRMRYSMLETIRQYAWERLVDAGADAEFLEAHARWFLELGERANAHWQGPEEGEWLARLAADNDNLRAVLRRETGEHGDPERAARLCGALMPFWLRRSQIAEGRRWLAAVTARGDAMPAAARASALAAAGHLATNDGDCSEARGMLEESIALHRQLGDKAAACRTLGSLSTVLVSLGEYDSAAELADEALAVARELGDWQRVSWGLHFAASAQIARHDHERSVRLLRERIELCREHESLADLAISLVMICSEVWLVGGREEAEALLDEGETIAKREGFGTFAGYATYQRGNLALWSGEHGRAAGLHKEALRAFRDLAYRPGIAHALDCLSYSLGASGCHRASMRAAGAAAALWAGMQQAVSPHDQIEQESYLGPVREALGDEADVLFDEGRLMPLEELLASLL